MSHQPSRVFGSFAGFLCLPLALTLIGGCKRDPNVQKHKYFESGERYQKEGKYKEAAIQFSNALKVDHNYAEAHYELAKVYIKLGSMTPGYQELLRTVNLQPNNLVARNDLGTMLLAGGAPDRAKDQADAILQQDPNNADAFALRANIALRANNRDEASKNVQRALALNPNKATYHTILAQIQATGPEGLGAAQGELQKAVELDPKSTGAHLALAGLLEKNGDHAAAEKQAEQAIQSDGQDLRARGALAELYLRNGDSAKAEETLRKAVDDLPDSEPAAELLMNYYLHANQLGNAKNTFADLRSKHSKSVPIRLGYGRVLLALRQYDQAAVIVDDLKKTNAGNPQVEMLDAALKVAGGKTDESLSELQKAVKGAPDNMPLRLMLAQVARSKGDMATAQTNFTEASRLDPTNLEAQTGLAQIASAKGDNEALIQIAEKAIAARPTYSDAYLWRGSAEANMKQYDRAEADFQQGIKMNPNNAVAYLELGQLRLAQGRIAEGRTVLEQALARNPDLIQATNLLVASDLQAKQPDKAVARLRDAISRAPNSSALYTDLAGLQLQLNDVTGARESANKAMQLDKNNAMAVQQYSQALVSQNNVDGAISSWQTWLNAHPNDPRATAILGTLEETRGDSNKAMDYYKQTLKLDPNQVMASNNLAYLMVENSGNPDVALTLAQTARRGLPNNPSTADTLAWVYYHKGTFESARDLLEDAVKQDPNSAQIHFHLGATYAKLGDKANASTQLKKAVSLAPPDSRVGKQAQTALSQLG